MNIRISTKGKRPLRSLTPSDKVHAIQRIHDGESKASVARDIGVPESTLRGWCKNEDKLRFMSRQCAAGKMGEEILMDKSGGDSNIMGGLQEKRQRLETQMPLNFSNKIKFDELTTFKRNSLTGLDFGGNKSLKDVGTYHAAAAAADYAAFNGSAKNKMFGADVALSTDPSIAAISPLSSLSHLSGLSGLSQSPLAISFTELTSNLNLLAQLNPGLAAMSNLNSLRAGNLKTKTQTHNPRSESAERQTCLSVKNWAKQKPPTPTPSDSSSFELNVTQNDMAKSQLKAPNAALMLPQLGANMCALPSLPEDPLLYWLKSQQAILGLNNLYPPAPPTMGAESPPIRSSTPQQQSLNASTPPIIPSPLTPSSTPSGSLDDKNSIWFNWYKAFGASLNSLSPAVAAATLQKNSTQETKPCGSNIEALENMQNQVVTKNEFENILYSQLTKDPYPSPAMQNYLAVEQRNFELAHNVDVTYKPEDLSAKTTTLVKSPLPSPLPITAPVAEQKRKQNNSNHNSETTSPIQIATEEGDLQESNETKNDVKSSVAECRDVLDSLLYEINNSNAKKNHNINGSHCISSTVSESDSSENSEQNQADECSFVNNNNHNSNKANEEEQDKGGDSNGSEELDADSREAITHGEKFLQWLENCSNPRVTTVQLMQLRFLITSIKTAVEPKSNAKESYYLSTAIEIDDSSEDSNRSKIRRRK